jgi:outer membrane protein assembly factor BamD (BamD/ComL family)
MEAERTVARYKLANSLFLAAGRPDSAATWYRRILQESGDHPVAKRALYALAESYRAQGDSTAAQQTYRRLVDRYPDTDLAVRARQRLDRDGPAPIDNRRALADSAYARVYEQWQQGRRDTLMSPFLSVAAQYPDTDAAPRALLAAGIVYWNRTQHEATAAPRRALRRHLRLLQSTDSTTLAVEPAQDEDAAAPARTDTTRSAGATQAMSDSVVAGDTPPRSGTATVDSARTGQSRRIDTLRTAEASRPAQPRSDSSRVGADTTARRDSVSSKLGRAKRAERADSSLYAPLEALMTHLTERYPDAPQVARAESMLALIKERQAASTRLADTTVADSAAVEGTGAASDTTVTDTSTTEPAVRTAEGDDEAQRPTPNDPDTTRTTATDQENKARAGDKASDNQTVLPAPTGRRDDAPQTAPSSREEIDRDQGGWTLLVDTFARSQDASTRVAEVGRRLENRWPVDLLREKKDGDTWYHLIVGQFRTEQAAAQAQARVGEQLSRAPQVWSLSQAGPGP